MPTYLTYPGPDHPEAARPPRPIIDLDYWCFREKTTDEDGRERLLIPHSDPALYENPVDLMFSSREAAADWRGRLLEDAVCILTAENMDTEDDCEAHAHEPVEVGGWVLVHYHGTPEYPASCDVVEDCTNPAVDCIGGEVFYCSVHALDAPAAYEAWQRDPERARRVAAFQGTRTVAHRWAPPQLPIRRS